MYEYLWFKLMDLGMLIYAWLSTQDVMMVTAGAVPMMLVIVLWFAIIQRMGEPN